MKTMSTFFAAIFLLAALALGAGPAQASITINNGAPFTVSPKVILALDFTPTPVKMQFFYNKKWTAPVLFAASKPVTLPGGDGPKTVQVRYLDANGALLAEESASITLDTKKPVGKVVINNKALYTNSREVELAITALDATSGLNGMCIKETNAACTAEEFEPFAAEKEHNILSPADGKKFVFVTLKDNAGKTSRAIKSNAITLDTTPPTNGLIVINGGKAETTDPLVKLKLAAVKATQMKLSLDGGISFGAYEKFVSSKKVTLPAGGGIKVVQVIYKDIAGNESALYEDSITLLSPVSSNLPINKGVITALGSIFVNGVEFSTNGATVKIDDNPGIETDLKVGMVVKVRGDKNDDTGKGIAQQVEARDALEGTITDVDDINKTITVMGQTVRIEDNMTRLNDDNQQKVFADANFQDNDHVEVHGFVDDRGGLHATRVARKSLSDRDFEAKGFVVGEVGVTSFNLALTRGGTSFVTVNYSAGTVPAGVTTDSFVEVKSSSPPENGAITATRIHLEDGIGAAGEKVEVEGIVTSGTLADFTINGTRVTTSDSTIFIGGLGSDFAIGVKLEAEGPVDANGTIAAVKIKFESSIKIEGDVSTASADSITVLGKTIAISRFTRFDNGAPVAGDHVEVRAILDRDGNLLARRIKVTSSSDKAFLQGTVTAFDATLGTLTILGSTINSDGSTEWRTSSNSTDVAVTRSVFFAQLIANVTIVKVKWDPFSSTDLAIKEAEIEIGK